MNSHQTIFVVNANGELAQMRPARPSSEDALQDLVARFPGTIGDSDGELLLVQREQPIADSESSNGRWSVDHLFVTKDAVPVLVEVKRASDTRIRREVVGQMLDYAANAVAYWPVGTIAQTFNLTCEKLGRDPEEQLQEFLGAEYELEEFWPRVDDNFRAGRLKLLFVADEIPRELARIVEFLNEQMTAEVLAVELRYFEGDGGFRTLVPRIIGATERAKAKRVILNSSKAGSLAEWCDTWLKGRGETTVRLFEHFRTFIQDLGEGFSIADKSVSVVIRNSDDRIIRPLSILYRASISVNFGYARQWLPSDQRREFYDRFASAVGPFSTTNYDGFPSFPIERLSDSQRAAAFEAVASDWISALRKS